MGGGGGGDAGSGASATRSIRGGPKTRNQSASDVELVTLHGVDFKVAFAKKLFYIEARGDAIQAFVTQLRVEMVPLVLRAARARVALPRGSPPSAANGDSGVREPPRVAAPREPPRRRARRVARAEPTTALPAPLGDGLTATAMRGQVYLSQGRYCVCYQQADGTRTTKTRGLAVPTVDGHGKALGEPAYAAALVEVRRRALQMWNQLDRSDRPRVAIPEIARDENA